jgi:pimeloyl-ACP methyl ester carboxylesterase
VDLTLDDGRALRVYDCGGDGPALVWHHGSPQTGAPLEPLEQAARKRGLRLVTYARPSYCGSTPQPGRSVADAAQDVAAIADALEIERFATMGASGGGPHALACAARPGGRVAAVVCLASLAPLTEAFDWWDGMADPSGLRAATQGREARAALPAHFDESSFTAADYEALEVRWASLGRDAGAAFNAGLDGLIDDDVAFVTSWGFALEGVEAPVLVVQGSEDRVVPPAHAHWLVSRLPRPELWLRTRDGHVSVLDACSLAMQWVAETWCDGSS